MAFGTFISNSFNTQPPEGGWRKLHRYIFPVDSFNTQPPEGGWVDVEFYSLVINLFQHTAARRRLGR